MCSDRREWTLARCGVQASGVREDEGWVFIVQIGPRKITGLHIPAFARCGLQTVPEP